MVCSTISEYMNVPSFVIPFEHNSTSTDSSVSNDLQNIDYSHLVPSDALSRVVASTGYDHLHEHGMSLFIPFENAETPLAEIYVNSDLTLPQPNPHPVQLSACDEYYVEPGSLPVGWQPVASRSRPGQVGSGIGGDFASLIPLLISFFARLMAFY
jgi:hypothetical protein